MAMDQWRRRKWLFIISFLFVFTVAVSLVVALPSLYRSSTTMLFSQDEVAESLLRTTEANELELRLVAIQQAVMSRNQLQEVIDAFDLYPEMRTTATAESVVKRFRKDIKVEQKASITPQWGTQSTYAITISYQDWDPDRAALVANELGARFRAENERLRAAQAVSRTEFVREQLAETKARFEEQQRRINDFKNVHMGELPEQQEFNMATLDRLNSELRLNGERQIYLLERRDGARPSATASGVGTGVTGLTGTRRLEWLKRDLAERQTRFTANHPDIIRLKSEISSLTKSLSSGGNATLDSRDGPARYSQGAGLDSVDLETELRTLKREENRLRGAIAGLVNTLEGTPKIEQELSRFASDFDTAKSEYLAMQKHYQDAYLAESLDTRQNQQFRIIEVAIPPDAPVAPNRQRLILLSLMLAVGVAAAALLLAEWLDRSFHSIRQIRRFTTLPVLATIPYVLTAGDRWRNRARVSMLSMIVVTGLLAMAGFSYYAGTHADQLVLAISY
jgi:polysaccharide chain length determinant protein (PEP-CTERM system associated)